MGCLSFSSALAVDILYRPETLASGLGEILRGKRRWTRQLALRTLPEQQAMSSRHLQCFRGPRDTPARTCFWAEAQAQVPAQTQGT
jgi:hypothetical protein